MSYVELIEFDKHYHRYGVHKRLEIYVNDYGTHNLNYYIAKLSHEIYKSRGIRGHNGRQGIREHLKEYAYKILRNW